jgi:hypothetical protein
MKGLCLWCGELFNLKDYHRNPRICPECAEVFETATKIGERLER